MTDEPTPTVSVSYRETPSERILQFTRDGPSSVSDGSRGGTDGAADASDEMNGSGRTVSIAQNREGYAMLTVRAGGRERERYYGFEMALDHAAELLGVDPTSLSIPAEATDMGM